MKILGLIFLLHSVRSYTFLPTYKAAVVEYAPIETEPNERDNFFKNVDAYMKFIQMAAAQEVQIIVFPENGLTNWLKSSENIEDFSTQVPDPEAYVVPCQYFDQDVFAKFFVDLSCVTKRNRIYAVINLIEERTDLHSQKKFFHNTNVVFDRDGALIARYRKINLYEEPFIVPGPKTVSTFNTDFEVTFGMFISSDILYQNPAQDVLINPFLTDVVYSSAWFTELPFLQANSIQHGYAISNGVNLLAAGLSDPSERNGGSGVYLAQGEIPVMYLSSERKSKLLVHYVPKITMRVNTSFACQGANEPLSPSVYLDMEELEEYPGDASFFTTSPSDLTNYTIRSLDLNNRVIEETVCSGDSDFCCFFQIVVNRHTTIWHHYIYKLVAYYGISKISYAKTIGVRHCALVACLDESLESCGGRSTISPSGLSFESLTVTGIFNPKDAHYQPSTLKFDLMPSTDYMFCTETISGSEMEVRMSTIKMHDSLLTFGIFGRVFINDDMIPGPINHACVNHSKMLTFAILYVLVFFSRI